MSLPQYEVFNIDPSTREVEHIAGDIEMNKSAENKSVRLTLASELDPNLIRDEISELYPTNEVSLSAFSDDLPISTKTSDNDGVDISKKVELHTKPNVKIRAARPSDIDELARIDVDSFWNVYKEYGKTREEMREEMRQKIAGRLEKIGYDWVQVLEDKSNNSLTGFMMCCPTSKRPEDFISWEQTTDNGTLETTYDPNGDYIYVVSLTMAQGTLHTESQNMLYANLIGKFISEGYRKAFFESRLPRLRGWMTEQCLSEGKSIDDLSDAEKEEYANQYLHLTKITKSGKKVALDPLIRTFSTVGCKFLDVVPNAYQDEPSMNFGVVSIFENPLPPLVSKIKPLRKVIGNSLRVASRSYKLMKRVF